MRNSDRGETGNEIKVTYLSPGSPKYLFQKKHRQPWLVAKHPLFNRKARTSFLFRNRNYSQGGKTDTTSIWERKDWRERRTKRQNPSWKRRKHHTWGRKPRGPCRPASREAENRADSELSPRPLLSCSWVSWCLVNYHKNQNHTGILKPTAL